MQGGWPALAEGGYCRARLRHVCWKHLALWWSCRFLQRQSTGKHAALGADASQRPKSGVWSVSEERASTHTIAACIFRTIRIISALNKAYVMPLYMLSNLSLHCSAALRQRRRHGTAAARHPPRLPPPSARHRRPIEPI